MKRAALTIFLVLVIGGATAEAAIASVMSTVATKKAETNAKAKKRRGFKTMLGKSLGFIAESAITGGMSDR
jgi:hypothetical protein